MFDFLKKQTTVILFCFVLLTSFFSYFYGYWNPDELFWDENYHVASAQKYLNGVFFMEQHPPLGKMLIALGEKIVNANPPEMDNIFIDTDYGKSIPADFSFAGYRLVPTVLAWLIAPLLFLIFLLIFRNPLTAALLSFLYIFDNALIVHGRSAMLETTLLFGMVVTILGYLMSLNNTEDKKPLLWWGLAFGAAFGFTLATKVTGLIMILLLPLMLWKLRDDLKKAAQYLGVFLLGFLIVYCFAWYLHFAIGKNTNQALENSGYYQASEQLKEIIDEGKTGSLAAFGVQLRDHLKFGPHYNRGVPKLDLCKPGENGSPWFMWPIGARTINFRWESAGPGVHGYLYLISNPFGWFTGLLGVALAMMLFGAHLLLPVKTKLKRPYLIFSILVLYVCYLTAISQIDRVMYLYHYFPPLIFSFILFGLSFDELTNIWKWKMTESLKIWILLGFSFCIFFTYLFYQQLTYYMPIDSESFQRRDIIRLWDLNCVNCSEDYVLGKPVR